MWIGMSFYFLLINNLLFGDVIGILLPLAHSRYGIYVCVSRACFISSRAIFLSALVRDKVLA